MAVSRDDPAARIRFYRDVGNTSLTARVTDIMI